MNFIYIVDFRRGIVMGYLSLVSLLVYILVCIPLNAQDDMPAWGAALFSQKLSGEYLRADQLKPSFLRGDFNGDGNADIALLIREKATGKIGIAILEGGRNSYTILGAGRAFGNGSDDFSWMDEWSVRHTSRRDQLLVGKSESASAVIYWNGARYRWRQEGD